MPLVLTIEIEAKGSKSKELAQQLSPPPNLSNEDMPALNTLSLKRESGIRGLEGVDIAKPSVAYKRIFGDWQKDSTALTRLYNLLNCLLGRFDLYV